MNSKEYTVTFIATTERDYNVTASSEDEAIELAVEALDKDESVSNGWKENADVRECQED